MSNIYLNRNINYAKLNCGIIHFCNDIKMTIYNSTFINNYNKSSGGAICFDNLSSVNFNISSSLFKKNKAVNGGALYFKNKRDNNVNEKSNDNMELVIENNIFMENIAVNFGGAIYSEFNKFYLATSRNNIIIENKAGVMGGGIFSLNLVHENLFNLSNCQISNNTVNSFVNDYTSRPSYITLNDKKINSVNITSGGHLPLEFTLYDEFDNIIFDVTKYYSSLSIKVVLTNEEFFLDDNNEDDDSFFNRNFYLVDNVCSFSQGICNLNNFRIFANPNIYIMHFKIEHYNDNNIQFKTNNITIQISKCNDNQIQMYDRNDILYCEDPKCEDSCPISKNSAFCYPSENNKYNDPKLNHCYCIYGWEGEFCIIKDNGIYKILIFCTSITMIFISNFFMTYENYVECSLNFLFKHLGEGLLIPISYAYIILSIELGVINRNEIKFKVISSGLLTENVNISESSSYDILKSNFKYEQSNNSVLYQNFNENVSNDNDSINKINKSIELKLMNINVMQNYKNKCVQHQNNKPGNTSNTSENDDDNLSSRFSFIKKFKNIYTKKDSVNDLLSRITEDNIDKYKILEQIIKNAHSLIKDSIINFICKSGGWTKYNYSRL
ncbi:hypothetical protein PIROE2DRAFT_6994 [Piromyces sp. E2]|nr:hypothetical protein PIROE2DRAFT_6994 [Piromyces sp. E2]|eukprot:OUM65923.1 hypothetical protein PIROE2DRAFT_6994 [Piromyces sp. E2]